MQDAKTVPILVIWLLCAASSAAAAATVLYEATHPLADSARRNLWLVYAIPYLVIAASAWALRRRPGFITMLLVATGVAAVFGTLARYEDLQTALVIMDARAAGRRAGSCGPPQVMFAMALEFGLAAFAAAAALRLLPLRPV